MSTPADEDDEFPVSPAFEAALRRVHAEGKLTRSPAAVPDVIDKWRRAQPKKSQRESNEDARTTVEKSGPDGAE